MRAFVLSGGASLGAIQGGMLQALFERGIAPDLIVGTSVGAINGAFIASREPTFETALELGGIWRGLRRGTVFPTNALTGFVGFIGHSDHLIPEGNLRRLIASHLQVERLEQMNVPLHVIVTNVLSGQELRPSTGPAIDTVLASAAIPGVFSPVEIYGRRLMEASPTTRRSRTRSNSAPRRSTCFRPGMRARWRNRRVVRSRSRSTRSAC